MYDSADIMKTPCLALLLLWNSWRFSAFEIVLKGKEKFLKSLFSSSSSIPLHSAAAHFSGLPRSFAHWHAPPGRTIPLRTSLYPRYSRVSLTPLLLSLAMAPSADPVSNSIPEAWGTHCPVCHTALLDLQKCCVAPGYKSWRWGWLVVLHPRCFSCHSVPFWHHLGETASGKGKKLPGIP